MKDHKSIRASIEFTWNETEWIQEEIAWDEHKLYAYGVLPSDGHSVQCKNGWFTLLYFVDRGEVEGVERCYCEPGNFLFLKNTSCEAIPSKGSCVWMAQFRPEFVDSLFCSQIADCPLYYDYLTAEPLKPEILFFMNPAEGERSLIAQLLQIQLESEDEYTLKNLRASMVLFITMMQRVHFKYMNISASTLMNEYLAGQILKYMSDNYATATLSSTAKAFNYHPNYFSVLFRNLIHCGFSAKLQQIRLERARYLLSSTGMTIEQIRTAIGFEEKSYFYRLFREKYGTTPAAWRKSIQKNVLK